MEQADPNNFNEFDMEELEQVGEFLATATAIAERQLKEQREMNALMGETGMSIPPMDEARSREMAIARTTLTLRRLQAPNEHLTIAETLEVSGASLTSGYDELTAEDPEFAELVSKESYLSAATDFVSEMANEGGFGDKQRAEDFQKEYTAAKQVAAEKGVSVADIFSEDELYAESVRRSYTPDELAQKVVKTTEGVVRMMTDKRAIARMAVQAMMPQLKETGVTEDEIMSELIQTMDAGDQTFEQLMEGPKRQVKQFTTKAIALKVTEYWGEDALNRLSSETMDMLIPRSEEV